jgi:hypothetical protein
MSRRRSNQHLKKKKKWVQENVLARDGIQKFQQKVVELTYDMIQMMTAKQRRFARAK